MTFEEFKKLALNPPYNYEPSVYRVDVFRIRGTENGESCLTIYPEENLRECFSRIDYIHEKSDENELEYYPEYKVCKAQSFLMPTFEDAKLLIHSEEISKDDYRPIYCIHIYELPFGKDVISDLCKREWVFDCKGNLLEQSVCSSLMEDLDKPEGHFRGRQKDSIRFKPGEIVEVHDKENGVVRLAIVLALCNDIESCWSEYQKVIENCKAEGLSEEDADNNYWLYACDDCYGVVYGPNSHENHSYPYTTDVFAPRFPIPENLKKQLFDCYNNTLVSSSKNVVENN
ncbi:MAG: hypothetical protein J5995_01045 [Muribaculaceae bacterium]|nr:hypothetical protein [Muribaculaceae bacterium]